MMPSQDRKELTNVEHITVKKGHSPEPFGPLSGEMRMRHEVNIEVNRILRLCNKAAPTCQVEVIPDEMGKFSIRVLDAGVTLIHPDFVLDANQLAAESDDQLWGFLERISNRLLRRPRS